MDDTAKDSGMQVHVTALDLDEVVGVASEAVRQAGFLFAQPVIVRDADKVDL